MTDGPHDAGAHAGRNAGDAERDAWLREALRHAPDASAGAPPSVRDAILRQAREATAGSHGSPAGRARHGASAQWASWWSWLMQPPIAAGFASVMVATLVGVMWWGQPIDEPLRDANLPDSHVPAATTAAAPVASPSPTPAAAPAATPGAPTAPAAQATPPAAPRIDELRSKTAPPEPRSARSMERAAEKEEQRSSRVMADAAPPREAPAQGGATASPAPHVADPAAERKRTAEPAAASARAVGRSAAPADMAADAPAETPVAKAAPSPFPAQPPAAPAAAAARPEAPSPSPLPSRDAGPGAGVAPGTATANLSRAARAAPESTASLAPGNPVARLRSAVAGAPGAWSWQRDGGPEQAMNDTVQAWLGRLDDTTRARWQAAPADGASAVQTLRLLRDGRLHTTLHIEPGAVRLEAAAKAGATGVPRAPLPAAAVADLAATLEQATP